MIYKRLTLFLLFVVLTVNNVAFGQGEKDTMFFWNYPPKDYNEFGVFMSQLVGRYSKWIKTWELWNESDISIYWQRTPKDFAKMIKIGSDAVRKTDPQAKVGESSINKELLFKDVRDEDRKKYGEKIILEMINWQVSGDPYFYENRHTPPVLIENAKQDGAEEYWIFYNTQKFSGKKLIVHAGMEFNSADKGVYNMLIWRGKGTIGEVEVEGGNFEKDELLITYERATKPLRVKNTGDRDLIIFKFFGPDINSDLPMLKQYSK